MNLNESMKQKHFRNCCNKITISKKNLINHFYKTKPEVGHKLWLKLMILDYRHQIH